MKTVAYKSGYKLQTSERYYMDVGTNIIERIKNKFCYLDPSGRLMIHAGYAWDGVSGPVPTTSKSLRASLIHDALYQFMKSKQLSISYRKEVDELFYQILREDGMNFLVARTYYRAVRIFGDAVITAGQREVMYAPKMKI
jgi:hypothetical protein